MYKGVIFDLDGTLLDTFADLEGSITYVLSSLNLPQRKWEEYLSFIGYGFKDFLYRSLPETHREEPLLEKAFSLFSEHYFDNCLNQTKPYEGILPLLTLLAERNIPLAVLSNKQDVFVKKICSYFFSHIKFVSVLGMTLGKPHKPDPTLAHDIANQMKLEHEDILYVGDSLVDVQTSDNAGFQSGFVLWGFFPEHAQSCSPKYIFNVPQDIFSLKFSS